MNDERRGDRGALADLAHIKNMEHTKALDLFAAKMLTCWFPVRFSLLDDWDLPNSLR
jgi:hypothetical protein